MIPGNEPTGDGRFVGITTVTAQQWQALARVIGRADMADDERARHDDRPLPARRARSTARSRSWTGARTADEVVAACVEARVPATIVGNGAELPRNDQLAARDVFVRQPGESWIRPRAPFRFHGIADRELAAPAAVDRGSVVAARASGRRTPNTSATARSRA